MSLEKRGSTITYETFVEDLDVGDSFTVSLIDILVREVAERHARPDDDKNLYISAITAEMLRRQASMNQVEGHRSERLNRMMRRRNLGISSQDRPPAATARRAMMSDSEGEEDYGTALNTGPFEGARINTDLYDAYSPSTDDLPGTLARQTMWRSGSSSPPPEGPVDSGFPPLSIGGASTSLTRQPSIRRASRTRWTDFDVFTSRRRTLLRNSVTQDDHSPPDSSNAPSGASGSGTAQSNAAAGDPDTEAARPWAARRRRSVPTTYTPGRFIDLAHWTTTRTQASSSAQLWHSLTSPHVSPPTAPTASSSRAVEGEQEPVLTPRLRRGGLHPPELVQALVTAQGSTPPQPDNLSSMTPLSSVAATHNPTHPTSSTATNGPDSSFESR
ncbi:hypothetical protein C8Q77DRAFT_1091067 [Trametes polyzona]|nr:hypothetical protein C8Q77DRAFT_1091067 [Trametes polyzona]